MNVAFFKKKAEPLPEDLMSGPDKDEGEFCATNDTPALHDPLGTLYEGV